MADGPQPGVRVACFATQGRDSRDGRRIEALLRPLHPEVLPFDHEHKVGSAFRLVTRVLRHRPDLLMMEGTGVGGGAVVLALRAVGIPYVVSSGDAVAPFLRAAHPWSAPLAWVYERALCRRSAGFVGWTPYLAGRALTLGAPRAMTAANWAPARRHPPDGAGVRRRLGIAPDAIVFGIAGSLHWDPRRRYCYGMELVRAAARTARRDVAVLVVGDGDGRPHLEAAAAAVTGPPVHLTGFVDQSEVADHLAAMDVAGLPQSVDGVGAFRYTTKLSEYLAAGVPVVTGRLPFAYDLDDGWLWRMEGDAPWDERYVGALARLMDSVTAADVAGRAAAVPPAADDFDEDRQRRRVCAFVAEIVEDGRRAATRR